MCVAEIVTVTVPLLVSAFAWHSTPKRPHRQSTLLPSSRRLKLTQWEVKVGREGGRGRFVEGIGLWGVCVGGFAVYKNTLNFLSYNAACVVIKRLSLSAGVRRVTRWRRDDAVCSHTPYFIDNGVKERRRRRSRRKKKRHNLKWVVPWLDWTGRLSPPQKSHVDVNESALL